MTVDPLDLLQRAQWLLLKLSSPQRSAASPGDRSSAVTAPRYWVDSRKLGKPWGIGHTASYAIACTYAERAQDAGEEARITKRKSSSLLQATGRLP